MKSFDRLAMRGEFHAQGVVGSAAPPPMSRWDHALRGSLRSDPPAALRVVRRVGATAQRVFDAWLVPEVAAQWLFATASQPVERIAIDARVGGWFRCVERHGPEVVEHIGEYVEMIPHRHLVFTLSVEKRPGVITRVAVDIAAQGAHCELTLAQVNVPRSCLEYVESRWTGMLYGLDDLLRAEPADA